MGPIRFCERHPMLPRSEDEQKIGPLIFFDQAMKWWMRKMMLSFKPIFSVENQ